MRYASLKKSHPRHVRTFLRQNDRRHLHPNLLTRGGGPGGAGGGGIAEEVDVVVVMEW